MRSNVFSHWNLASHSPPCVERLSLTLRLLSFPTPLTQTFAELNKASPSSTGSRAGQKDAAQDHDPHYADDGLRSRLLGSAAWSQSRKGSLGLTTIEERFSTSTHDLCSHAARRS